MIVNIPCLEAMTMKIIDSISLYGTYCICLANVHYLIVMRRVIENKQLINVAKSKGRKQKLFKLMIWKRDMTVLNVTIFYVSTVLKVSFSECDLCLALSYSYLYVIFFLQ